MRWEQKLVLHIIDAKDHITEERFICGFELAWKLSTELNAYDRSRPADEAGRLL